MELRGGRALGNALSFSAAGYYDTINIGNAESYGAELELRYKLPVAPGLVVGFNGGVNHATLTSSINPLTARTAHAL